MTGAPTGRDADLACLGPGGDEAARVASCIGDGGMGLVDAFEHLVDEVDGVVQEFFHGGPPDVGYFLRWRVTKKAAASKIKLPTTRRCQVLGIPTMTSTLLSTTISSTPRRVPRTVPVPP